MPMKALTVQKNVRTPPQKAQKASQITQVRYKSTSQKYPESEAKIHSHPTSITHAKNIFDDIIK